MEILDGSKLAEIFVDGVYADLPAELYHSQLTPSPSLSSSMARGLLNECPAMFWHNSYLNPERVREEKSHFDIGHAVHLLYLEEEKFADAIFVVEAEDWRTKAAREARDAARSEGKIPLLEKNVGELLSMRKALLSHPIAGKAFSGEGFSELSLVWKDKETGVFLKARPDWTPANFSFLVDLKTSTTANPNDFARKAYGLGYHQQAAWYLDAAEAVLGERPGQFWFVVQDKSAPFLCSVVAFDAEAIAAGRELNRRAIRQFAECLDKDEWPGYRNEGTPDRDTAFILSLPNWAQREVENILIAAD